MQMNLPENLKHVADTVVETYRAGSPVIILDENERCLHGNETLQAIIQTGASLKATVIQIDRQEFEASDLPEICEAARMVWLEDGFPTK
jgi:hypothetical protein